MWHIWQSQQQHYKLMFPQIHLTISEIQFTNLKSIVCPLKYSFLIWSTFVVFWNTIDSYQVQYFLILTWLFLELKWERCKMMFEKISSSNLKLSITNNVRVWLFVAQGIFYTIKVIYVWKFIHSVFTSQF